MNNLFTSNLNHHPGRRLASVIGVAVGVILVVLAVGLVRRLLRDRWQRANIGVEIVLRQGGQGFQLTSSANMTISESDAEAVRAVPGVAAATPVGRIIETGGSGGHGIRLVDGIDFQSFAAASNMRIAEGRPLPQSGAVAIIDSKEAANRKIKVGDKIRSLGRDLAVVGIYEPEAGARVKVPLATMQDALGAPGKCSVIFVKCKNADEQEAVAARILEKFPNYSFYLTRDLPLLSPNRSNVVKALATVIILLIILLATYIMAFRKNRRKMNR